MTTIITDPRNRPLTYRQQRFVEELLLDPARNGSAAAKRAGFSPKASKEIAYDLLSKPHIQAKIEEDQEVAAKKLGITRERVLLELAQIGFANLKHLISQDEEGNTNVNLSYLPENLTSPISELRITTTGAKGSKVQNATIKLADKRQALIDMAKMMGWYKDKVEVTGQVSLEQLIEASMSKTENPVSIIDSEALDVT